jgi:hypothetical protein
MGEAVVSSLNRHASPGTWVTLNPIFALETYA